MADIIEIPIVVKDGNVKRAVATVGRLEREILRAVKAVDGHTKSQERLNAVLLAAKREYQTLGLSSQKATAEVRRYAQAQQQQIAAQKASADAARRAAQEERYLADLKRESTRMAREHGQELDRLRSKYNPLYAASKQYERGLAEIDRALEMGAVSTRQHAMAVNALEKEYREFTAGSTTATNQFNQAVMRSTRGIGQWSTITQQAGYQIGDFLVQVQSGTNWMVAFGQQATQVAGTMTLLGGRMLYIGAALSVIIPLVTALGAAWMRTRDNTEDTKEEVYSLSQALSQLNTVQKTTSADFQSGLVIAFDESATAVGRLIEKLRELEFQAIFEPIRSSMDTLRASFDQVGVALDRIVALEGLDNLSRVQQRVLEDSKALVEQNQLLIIGFDQVNEALNQISESRTSNELTRNIAEAVELLQVLGGPVADEVVSQLLEMAREAGVLQEVIGQSEEATREASEEAKNLSENLSAAERAAIALLSAARQIPGVLGAAAAMAGAIADNVSGAAAALAGLASATVEAQASAAGSRAEFLALESGLDRVSAARERETAAASRRLGINEAIRQGRFEEADAILNQAAVFGDLAAQQEAANISAEDYRERIEALTTEISGSGGGGGGGANRAIEDLTSEVESLNEEFENSDPLKQYANELERLNKLRAAGLSDGAFAQGIRDANIALAESNDVVMTFVDAFTGFLDGSIKSFEDFAKSILSGFRQLLAQMIREALLNQIGFNMGVNVRGQVGGAVGKAVVGGGRGGGLFGNLFSGAAGFAGTGKTGFMGGFGNALGGGGLFNIGSNAALAGGGIGATLGAVAPVAIGGLAIAALLGALGGGEKTDVGSTIEVRFKDGMPVVNGTERFEEAPGIFGGGGEFNRLVDASEDQINAVETAYKNVKDSVNEVASMINLQTEGLGLWEGYSFNIDTWEKSAEEIQAAIIGRVEQMTQDYAQVVLQNAGVYDQVVREGEGAADALNRIVTSLTNVNDMLEFFNRTLYETSVNGAIAASQLSEFFGGDDAMQSSMNEYFQNFYSQEEQFSMRMAELERQFSALNTSLPETKEEYRALVDAQDLSTESGRALFAALVQLSGEFSSLKALSEELGGSLAENLANTAREAYNLSVRLLNEQINAQQQLVTGLENLLRIFDQALFNRSSLSIVEERMRRAESFAELRRGIDDPTRLSQVLGRLNEPTEGLFGNYVDFARDFRDTTNLIQSERDKVEKQLTVEEQSLNTLREQLDQLRSTYGVLLGIEEDIQELPAALAALEDAVRGLTDAIFAMIGGVSGSRGARELGSGAFQVLSDDMRNAIFSDPAIDTFTDTAKTISDLYRNFLGRNPDAEGLAFYGNLLQQGKVTTAGIAADIAGSSEGTTGVIPGFSSMFGGATTDPVSAAYQTILGRSPDAAGAQFWANTGLKGQALADAIKQGAIASGEIPRFSSGGMHIGGMAVVGESGPELVNMGASRVFNAGQTKRILSGETGAATASEVRALRSDIRSLNYAMSQSVKYAKRTSDTLRTWDNQGQPQERVF